MKSEIVKLLISPEDTDLRLGIALMGSKPEFFAPELMESISKTENGRHRTLVDYVRSRLPFLGDSFRGVSPAIGKRTFNIGDDYRVKESIFLEGVNQWLDLCDSDISRYLYTLAGHKALYGEYEKMIVARWGQDGLKTFNQYKHIRRDVVERQLGLVPTYQCNLKCVYCMSADMPKTEASLENIRFFLKWSLDAGIRKIRLYGGEPTCYPYFETIMGLIREAGLKTYFPSNLLFPKKILTALDNRTVDVITIHMRSPIIAGLNSHTFLENALALKKKGIEIRPRYNLRDEDWLYLIDDLDRLGSDTLSFAEIVDPRATLDIQSDYWLQKIELISRFVRFMQKNNISLTLAKALPSCLVSHAGLNDLWHILQGHCGVHRDEYAWNILVRPDMTLALCDGDFLQQRPLLWDFNNWEELRDYVAPRMQAWQEALLNPICKNCYFQYRALCQGFCLAMKGSQE